MSSIKLSKSKYCRRLWEQQPIKKRKHNRGCFQKFLFQIDIFSFIPTPKAYPVSTKKSRCGSATLLIIFLAYIIFDLYDFITNNPPTLNIVPMPLSTTNYPVPEIAVGFIYGENLNYTLANSSFFTIAVDQTYQQLGVRTTHNYMNLISNCSPSWLGNISQIYSNLSCINASQFLLSGVPLSSYQSYYPRIQVLLCNNASGNCCSAVELYQMTSGGRLFIFIKKPPSVNYMTGELVQQSTQFEFNTYFLIPYLYNRINIILQPNNYIVYPDYLKSFTKRYYLNLQIVTQEFQNSNVSIYNTSDTISISFILAQNQIQTQIHYTTFITHVSLWGALWGVLLGIFGFIFLAYNRKKYYEENPDWQDFEEKLNKQNDPSSKRQNSELQDQVIQPQPIQYTRGINDLKRDTEMTDIGQLRRQLVSKDN